MIVSLVKGITGWLAGGIGHKVGTFVTDGAAIAALVPAVIWLVSHKDELAVSFTYGQIAIFGLLFFGVIKIAHYTRAGRVEDRNGA